MTEEQDYIKQLENTIQQVQSQVDELTEMVNSFIKQIFGSSSEKTPKDELAGRVSIFNEAEIEANPKAVETGFTTANNHAHLRKSCRKNQIIGDVPVKETLIDVPQEDKT